MPTLDDISSFIPFWQQRLIDLRNAGTNALNGRRRFDAAMECKPYAFSYAGEGQCCRRWFCPYCNAAEAAVVYERLRRVIQQHGSRFGFILNRVTTREMLTDLPSMIKSYLGADAERFGTRESGNGATSFGAMMRCAVWPHETESHLAVLQPWVILAVTLEYSKRVYNVWKKRRRAKFREDDELDYGERCIVDSEDSSIRRAPFSLAKAAARICQFPIELLTAPPTRVATLLNAIDDTRLSTIRGVFRSPLPFNPEKYPMQFVPTNNDGKGIVEWVLAHSTVAAESTVAREFAIALGLPASDTFAALSPALGLPIYWLGQFRVGWSDFARSTVKKNSELHVAINKIRPRKPPERHALVCLCPDFGLLIFSTWPPQRDANLIKNAFSKCAWRMLNVPIAGQIYSITELSTFRVLVEFEKKYTQE